MPAVTRYQDPELCDALAADYVTGRMTPLCRARLERICLSEPQLASAVHRWSARMAPLQNALPEYSPPDAVWSGIEQHIAPPKPVRAAPLRQQLWAWRLATLASLALVLLLVFTPFTAPPKVVPAYLAPLSTDGEIRLIVSAYQGTKPGESRLLTQWTKEFADRAPTRAFLWAQGAADEAPVLLGEIGPDDSEWTVTPERWKALKSSQRLLVTIDRNRSVPQPILSGPCLQLHYSDS